MDTLNISKLSVAQKRVVTHLSSPLRKVARITLTSYLDGTEYMSGPFPAPRVSTLRALVRLGWLGAVRGRTHGLRHQALTQFRSQGGVPWGAVSAPLKVSLVPPAAVFTKLIGHRRLGAS